MRPSYGSASLSRCDHYWDSFEARLEPCAVQLLPVLSAAFALLIALWHLLRAYAKPWFPAWLQPFIPPDTQSRAFLERNHAGTRHHWHLKALVFFTVFGFAIKLLHAFIPVISVFQGLFALVWLVASTILILERPRTVSCSMFYLHSVLAITQLIASLERDAVTVNLDTAFDASTLTCSCVIIFTLLSMGWRDPRYSDAQIAKPSQSPSRHLRSPEDAFSLGQFLTVSWVSRLLSTGSSKQLNDEDVWGLPFEFQHSQLHERFRLLRGSVLSRLLQANGLDCLITTLIGVIQLAATFAGPVLLQRLLQAMEDERSPPRAAIVYAALSLVARIIAGQMDVLDLWFSRRCYERSRGEIITMLYQKTLTRKPRTNLPADQGNLPENSPESNRGQRKPISWAQTSLRTAWSILTCTSCFGAKEAPAKPPQSASLGKIFNLFRNDTYEISQRFWEIKTLVTVPLGLIWSIALVWQLMGWSCLVGVLAVIIAQAANAIITKILYSWERKRRASTDKRLQISSEIVECIRHLRYYGWQQTWITKLMEQRQEELNMRIVTACWNILIAFNSALANGVFPVASFYAYTALSGHALRIDIAFPAIQLLSMLEASLKNLPGLVTTLINASVAMGRIEDFMQEPDKNEGDAQTRQCEDDMSLSDASFAWPGSNDAVLKHVSLTLSQGLNIVYGKVGAGKTALLLALLGEMDLLSGSASRYDRTVAYCSQTPWLETMSIRDNILFASPFNKAKYKSVLDACALTPDLATFKHGDLSQLGENGVGLSGGQRARVALARAIYSGASILLLDDPISALDHDTAEKIVENALCGPLMAGRTVVLVTHRTHITQGLSQQSVEVIDGAMRVSRTTALTSGYADLDSESSIEASEQIKAANNLVETAAIPDQFIEEEHRATGDVQARIYWQYIKAGKYRWWLFLVLILTTYRMVDTLENWLLKSWAEAYDRHRIVSSQDIFDDLPSPEDNVNPWLVWFLVIAVGQSFVFLCSRGIMAAIVYSAGKTMFREIIQRICHAPFRYYDVTPVGRLMNRLTGDIGTVDGNISEIFQAIIFQVIAWLGSLIVIASVTPVFFVFAVAMSLAFVLIFRVFLPTSQSLRRLEFVSLTPLMSNFSALLHGLITVRAYHAQDRFQERNIDVTDAFQRQDHFFWSTQAWLMYRFELLAAFSTFLLTMLALYTKVSAGLVAFVLSAASKFVVATNELCRQWGQLQMDFISVERVVEMLDLEQEPPGSIEPPAAWPSVQGDIVLEHVTLRYAPNLDPALNDLSLTIKGGKSTAILGRTGSGKTTLVTALLATTALETGRILIDGIDVSKVDKQALRQRVTFLAQDPLLFPGTMRQNVDPLGEFDDEACERVLGQVAQRHGFTINSQVDTGGQNLSQGQRQLVGLARAVLRRSPIIILDEATASIDMETAMEIQQVLREEMSQSTVITIAHRVEAVKNAQFAIVLGDGNLISAGPTFAEKGSR